MQFNPTSEGGGWNPSPPHKNAYNSGFKGSGDAEIFWQFLYTNILDTGIGFGSARGLLKAQEPPFWSLVLIFGHKNPNFWMFLGFLGVRLDWDMWPNIYLCPMDQFQPLLDFVFIIFKNITIYHLFPSTDFRGAQGKPLRGFWPRFHFRGPNYNWVKRSQSLTDPTRVPMLRKQGGGRNPPPPCTPKGQQTPCTSRVKNDLLFK